MPGTRRSIRRITVLQDPTRSASMGHVGSTTSRMVDPDIPDAVDRACVPSDCRPEWLSPAPSSSPAHRVASNF